LRTFVPPLAPAGFCPGGEIGTNDAGKVLDGVGLANAGNGPQSNDTGAAFKPKV